MSALIRFGETVFSHLLDAAWKGTALIVVVFALCLILGRRRTAARYWLCVYCLVGLLVLLVASFVAREHRFALLPARQAVAGVRSAARESEIVFAPSEQAPTAEAVEHAPSPEPAAADHLASESAAESLSAKSPAPGISVVPSTSTRGLNTQAPVLKAVATTSRRLPLRAAIGLAWLAVCFLLLVRLALAAIATARLRRSSIPASSPLVLNLFERAKESAGLRTRAKLRLSGRIASPISIGVFRASILLPESLAQEMPPEQLRPILLHELAHIRMGDYAVNVVQRFIEALLFFHPFVYLLNRRVRRLREEICDNWVLSRLPDAIVYAKALTALAERWISPKRNLVGVGLFSRPVRLSSRIERILASGMRFSTSLRLRTALVLLAVFALAVGALSVTTLSARAAKPEKKEPAKTETVAPAETPAAQAAISWKDNAVHRDGKPHAKIVQWEPEADLPMVAFGDQNNNSKTDTWIRFLNGKPLRIEIDSNEDGRIDKWEHYFDGVIDLVEVDTDFNRKVDLWQVYDNGKLFREEIDLNADGSVDKWLEVDEQGNKVQKEILSWVVRGWLEARSDPGAGGNYRPADATFFNAADRVEKTEVKPRSEPPATSSPGPAPSTASPPQPQFRLLPFTGCRIEYTKEVDGNKVVAGWFHESLSREWSPFHGPWESVAVRPQGYYGTARYLSLDIGFDGGVDCWAQLGPPVTETPSESAPKQQPPLSFQLRGDVAVPAFARAERVREPLLSALSDDTNRDGKADRVYMWLEQDANRRQIGRRVCQTDSEGEGLVDALGSDPGRPFRLDADHDGIFESFDPQWRLSPLIEANGTSSLRVELRPSAGPEPAPLFCTLMIPGLGEGMPYRRAFWLVAGEAVTIPKLSRGAYDLSLSVGGSDDPNDREVTTFSYPGFLVLEKGQSVSKILAWDGRPVFRGKLISTDARPVAARRLIVLTPGGDFDSVSVGIDPAGDFELFNIPPGRYTLTVRWGTGEFRQAIQIPAAGEKEPERQLFLTSLEGGRGQIPTGWEAPLALSGKVLSHDGQPLANMAVEVSSLAGERIRRSAITGVDGSYRIFALVPGLYAVAIYNNDFPSERRKSLGDFQVQIEKTPMQKDLRLSQPLPVVLP